MTLNFSTLKRRFRGNDKELEDDDVHENDLESDRKSQRSSNSKFRANQRRSGGGGIEMNDRALHNMMKLMDDHDKMLTYAEDSDKQDSTYELRPTP